MFFREAGGVSGGEQASKLCPPCALTSAQVPARVSALAYLSEKLKAVRCSKPFLFKFLLLMVFVTATESNPGQTDHLAFRRMVCWVVKSFVSQSLGRSLKSPHYTSSDGFVSSSLGGSLFSVFY